MPSLNELNERINGLYAAYAQDKSAENTNALHAALLPVAKASASKHYRDSFDTFTEGGKPLTPHIVRDLVHHIFEKLQEGKFSGHCPFIAWARIVFRNVCIDEIRKLYLPNTNELKDDQYAVTDDEYDRDDDGNKILVRKGVSQETRRIENQFDLRVYEDESGNAEEYEYNGEDEKSTQRYGCSPISPKGLDPKTGEIGLGAFDRLVYQQGYSPDEIKTIVRCPSPPYWIGIGRSFSFAWTGQNTRRLRRN